MMNLGSIVQELESHVDGEQHEGLVALDDRKVTTTQTSALISIPKAKDLGMVEEDTDQEASVSVRLLDNEIVVTARIPRD